MAQLVVDIVGDHSQVQHLREVCLLRKVYRGTGAGCMCLADFGNICTPSAAAWAVMRRNTCAFWPGLLRWHCCCWSRQCRPPDLGRSSSPCSR